MAPGARQYWHRLPAKVGAASLLLAFVYPAAASESPVTAQNGGVSIAVQRLKDRVSFCVRSDGDHKVSSDFGIEFKVDRGDRASWRDKLPRIVTGPDWYFPLPMKVDLDTRKDPGGQVMHIELGACSAKQNRCEKLEFAMPIPTTVDEVPMNCAVR